MGERDGRIAEDEAATAERRSTRRRVLKWLIGGGAVAFAAALALPALAIRSLQLASTVPASGDLLVSAPTDAGVPVGEPLNAANLAVGEATQAFPKGKTDEANNLIEVVRIAEGAAGIVAYSAICTHLGCAVYADLNDAGLIACPCHASFFAPSEDAAVVGGPAPRPLPSLPVTVADDGTIVVAGTFSAPVGPL